MFQLQRDHTSQPFQEGLCLWILERSLDQLYTLPRVLEGSSKFAQPVNMLIWKRHLTISLVVSSGRCSTGMVSWPYRKGCSVSVLPEQKLGLHCRSDLFLVHVENQSSKYEAMVLDCKRVAYPLWFGGEVVFSHGGEQVSWCHLHEWGKEGLWDYKAEQCTFRNYVVSVQDSGGEERAELKGKSLHSVCLHSHSHLWSWTLGSDRKDESADTSGGRSSESNQCSFVSRVVS